MFKYSILLIITLLVPFIASANNYCFDDSDCKIGFYCDGTPTIIGHGLCKEKKSNDNFKTSRKTFELDLDSHTVEKEPAYYRKDLWRTNSEIILPLPSNIDYTDYSTAPISCYYGRNDYAGLWANIRFNGYVADSLLENGLPSDVIKEITSTKFPRRVDNQNPNIAEGFCDSFQIGLKEGQINLKFENGLYLSRSEEYDWRGYRRVLVCREEMYRYTQIYTYQGPFLYIGERRGETSVRDGECLDF